MRTLVGDLQRHRALVWSSCAYANSSAPAILSRPEAALAAVVKPITSPAVVRGLRGVEALGRIGTPDAQELLRVLALGAEGVGTDR